MEAHIDDVCLGTNLKEDHYILLQQLSSVCQEYNLRMKLEKRKIMKEEMEHYLGLDVGHSSRQGKMPSCPQTS